MRTVFTLLASIMLAWIALPAAETVRVITDRTQSHLTPILDAFTKASGVKVETIFVEKGLLARLQANPGEADVVISASAENLERARVGKALRAFDSAVLSALPQQYVDPDKAYVVLSYRARGFFVSKDRVPKGAIATYEDLSKPEWQGKVLVRSGSHDYNVALFSQMAASQGLEFTKRFIAGLKANRARVPKGSDRDQVRAIKDGEGAISIGNSYYYAIMLGNPDQKAWAEATRYVFPDQGGKGTYVMRAGAGLTVADRAVAQATKLLEFLVSEAGQTYVVSSLNEYPILPGIAISDINKTLGAEQPEVKEGRFKINLVSLRDADAQREAVVKMLAELNFDQ